MSTQKGRFVWFDLMTSDMDAAKAFYSETIGWKTSQWEGGKAEMPYSMWMVGEGPIGGVMTLPDEAKAMGVPPHWMAYVAVDDVDASAAQAKSLGGQVHREPWDIPEVGRAAIIADPQGAAIALFKPANDMPLPDKKRSGDVSWHELNTTDLEAGFEFYSELFGWEKTEDMDMGPEMGNYRMYKWAGAEGSVGGMSNAAKTQGFPASWLYYITVDDIDAAVTRAKNNGAKLVHGPMEVPGGDKVAQLTDPQGAMFALHASKPAS